MFTYKSKKKSKIQKAELTNNLFFNFKMCYNILLYINH